MRVFSVALYFFTRFYCKVTTQLVLCSSLDQVFVATPSYHDAGGCQSGDAGKGERG